MGDELDIDLMIKNANTVIEKYGLIPNECINNLSFNDIFGFNEPKQLQKIFANSVDDYGLYILEAPMGVGKTEAALYASYKALESGKVNGIYFGLPTQTTSNSMFERYKNFVSKVSNIGDNDIRLIHGNQSIAEVSNSGMYSWFKSNKRAILSNYGLGTLDQAMMSVLGQFKHFFIRTFGLSKKVIIMDEIHSYDVYSSTIVSDLINDLIEMDCIVIVLSATLTKNSRGKLLGTESDILAYPLISKKTNEDFVNYIIPNEKLKNKIVTIRKVEISCGDYFISSRMKEIKECINRYNNGEKILWIENTVNDSQLVYSEFLKHIDNVGLLHSQFTISDRTKNESKWVSSYGKNGERGIGSILVSTQVCEQSIDIDADYLVTSLAPSDMLLQRIGRLHRHDFGIKRNEAICTILYDKLINTYKTDKYGDKMVSEFVNLVKSGAYVYDSYILRKTWKIWKSLDTINIPNDMSKILDDTYNSIDDKMDAKFKTVFDKNNRQQKSDAISSMNKSYGTLNDDIGSIIDTDNHYGTRRILQKSYDLILAKSANGNELTLLDGKKAILSSRMDIDSRKYIHSCSVKVNEKVINDDSIRKVIFNNGKVEYCYCIVNDGILINGEGKLSTLMYDNKTGFMKN